VAVGGDRFATTHWSVVLKARSLDEAESREALATLCQAYWSPVFSYVRSRGHDVETARDLTQSFFAVLLERRGIADARRERGRFRSFLLTSAKNFLSDEHDHRTALKRGGGHAPISIDDEEWASVIAQPESAARLTPEAIFERRWAMALLERARRDLEDEMERSGARERFRRLRPYLISDSDPPYAALAAELSMTESAVRVALHRIRHRFGAKVREHVARTVDDPAKTEDELRYLINAMGA
jgi:RNA polymerase sigma-70 factor (ECF subfamily)